LWVRSFVARKDIEVGLLHLLGNSFSEDQRTSEDRKLQQHVRQHRSGHRVLCSFLLFILSAFTESRDDFGLPLDIALRELQS